MPAGPLIYSNINLSYIVAVCISFICVHLFMSPHGFLFLLFWRFGRFCGQAPCLPPHYFTIMIF